MSSLFPTKVLDGIQQEAKNSKVSVSILLIVALVYGAFWLGENRSQEVQDATKKIDKMEITLEKVSAVLERLEENQREQSKSISGIEEKSHKMNTEIVVMGTKMEELYKSKN